MFKFLLALLFISSLASAEEVEIPTVIIDDRDSNVSKARGPIDEYSVFKTEQVSKKKFEEPQRQSLADLVQDQVGVDSQVYCANCGAKRLTINGLKGEHTSILVDGIPLHSAVSSFYGVDSVPLVGLSDVLVMRGAGASLVNPEAIGGTLNLVTINPLDAVNKYGTSYGVDDRGDGKSQNHSLIYSLRNKGKTMGLSLGTQFARTETWDVDENRVSEMPQRENFSGLAKTRILLNSKNDISLRYGYSELEILGGFVDPVRPRSVRTVAAGESDFVNRSVEELFIGSPDQITDWIELTRNEAAWNSTHYIGANTTIELKYGYARQKQRAIYQHGFDYGNVDNLFVGDNQLKLSLGSGGVLTLGAGFRDQRLRSVSEVLFEQHPPGDIADIPKDSFDYNSYALYLQYSWAWQEALEIDLALRADNVKIDWLELNNSIDETVVAPRLQVLHNFNSHLSQRFSYGLGYRAPLTFFESQHGNNESGYQVDITDMELAHSAVYSLSYNTPSYYVTSGVHYTHLENMAFGFESINSRIFYRNSDEDYEIWVADLLVGIKPFKWWLVEMSYEFFDYEDGYKSRLPTAAIEDRIQLRSTMDRKKWAFTLSANAVGARDLSKYGSYSDHFVNRNEALQPILDPTLEKKDQESPFFFTMDAALSYKFSKAFVLTAGVNNIFDYTQTGEGDSPATWHWHFVHHHYDGLHTWGPNTGRQWFLKLSGQF